MGRGREGLMDVLSVWGLRVAGLEEEEDGRVLRVVEEGRCWVCVRSSWAVRAHRRE